MKYNVYSEPVTIDFDCFDHKFTKIDANDSQHWNVCSVCGVVDESSKSEHVFGEWVRDGKTKTRTCECGVDETTSASSTQAVIIIIIASLVILSASVFAVIFVKNKKAS